MKLWTLTTNTEDGVATTLHLTEEAAIAAKTRCLKKDWHSWLMGEFPGSEAAAEVLGDTVGYMDSYDIEGHDLELPFLPAEELAVGVTARGFPIIEFVDRYARKSTLQDSSLATEACVWLGGDNERSHLTQDMVRSLLPALIRFVETGTIATTQE